MVDYSKWDHFDDSSDEASVDDTTLRVSRLDAPSTIQTSSDGSIHILASGTPPPVAGTLDDEENQMIQTATRTNISKNNCLVIPIHWTREGSRQETDQGVSYFWSQDRSTATLRIILPSKDDETSLRYKVELTNILSYRDRHVSAMATPGSQLLSIANSTTTVLDRVLAHPVHLAENDEDIDWCIQSEDGFERVLSVTLHKATPMANMAVWWKRIFIGDTERDETEGNAERRMKQQQFEEAWLEAHEQFRTNVRSRQRDKVG